jgi:hypothetical protein
MEERLSRERLRVSEEKRPALLLNIVAAVITVVGVLFTMTVYFYDKKTKEIRIVLLDSTAFFQNKIDFGPSISVNVGGQKVDQLWYSRVRYENSG